MTAKEAMEEARLAWHVERSTLDQLKDEINDLQRRFGDQVHQHDRAHRAYKEAKAVWRTGRMFHVTDVTQAQLLRKLRDGGTC